MKTECIRAFAPLDVHELNLLPVFEHAEHRRRERFADNVKAGCPAYTITFPGTSNPMACLSGRFVYERVFRAFALVDVEVEDFPIYYVKQLRVLINYMFKRYNLARMEVVMRADQSWCDHWAKVLGFEKEATMKKYGDELVDYHLFARVV